MNNEIRRTSLHREARFQEIAFNRDYIFSMELVRDRIVPTKLHSYHCTISKARVEAASQWVRPLSPMIRRYSTQSPTSYGTAKQMGIPSIHTFGRGKVHSGRAANKVLADLKLDRDFEYTRPEQDAKLMFVHRKLTDGDIYFVDNRKNRVENLNVSFRCSAIRLEIDNPRSTPESPGISLWEWHRAAGFNSGSAKDARLRADYVHFSKIKGHSCAPPTASPSTAASSTISTSFSSSNVWIDGSLVVAAIASAR